MNDKSPSRIEESLEVFRILRFIVLYFFYIGPILGLIGFPAFLIGYLIGNSPVWQVYFSFFVMVCWIISLLTKRIVEERVENLQEELDKIRSKKN